MGGAVDDAVAAAVGGNVGGGVGGGVGCGVARPGGTDEDSPGDTSGDSDGDSDGGTDGETDEVADADPSRSGVPGPSRTARPIPAATTSTTRTPTTALPLVARRAGDGVVLAGPVAALPSSTPAGCQADAPTGGDDRPRLDGRNIRNGSRLPFVMLIRLPGTYPAQGDTALLSRTLERRGLAAGRDVLDVCTGGGALALAAAGAGAASVTAVDLSLRSVLTARANALLNRRRVRVVQGDLFAPVVGRRFGLVLANPPYVPAASDDLPRHRPGRSWDGGLDGRAIVDRICAEVPQVLAEDGALLLTHSVLSDEQETLDRLEAAGLDAEVVERADEPFGPVMHGRAELLRRRGLLQPGQTSEELVVIEARLRVPAVLEAPEGAGGRAA